MAEANGNAAGFKMMGAWRGEYSYFEIQQMALCLLGTPLAAFFFGCVARSLNPRLNAARCMVVGLVCAAGAAMFCFATFTIWVLQTRGDGSAKFVQFFDGQIGWRFPILVIFVAMFGAGVVTVAAARFKKIGEADPQTGGRINLRQLFLLQLLPFFVLGSWMGMRSVALNSLSELDRAVRRWTQRGFELQTDNHGRPTGLACHQHVTQLNYGEQDANLRAAAGEGWLKKLRLGEIRDPSRLRFSPLSKSTSLEELELVYGYGSDLSLSHLQELGRIKSLKSAWLRSSGSFCGDLAPLAQLPNLRSLQLNAMTIAPADLNRLTATASIESLTLTDLTATDLQPLAFPATVVELRLHTRFAMTLDPENFRSLTNLSKLTLGFSDISRADLAASAAAPNLESLYLHGVSDPADLELLMGAPRLSKLRFAYMPGPKKDAACEAVLQKLARHPNLRRIECDPKFLIFWGDSVADLVLAEVVDGGPVSGRTIGWGEKDMKKLVELGIPKFQATIDKAREELRLEKLELEFFPFSTKSITYFNRAPYKKPNALGGGS